MRSDDGDAANLRGIERKLRMVILQQNGALLRDLLRHFKTAHYIDHALYRRVVDHASGKHRSQNPVNVVVEFRHRYLAGLNRILKILAIEELTRLFVIEPGGRCFSGAVYPSPVGENKSFELPFLLEKVIQQIFILAGIVAPDA